MFNDFKKFVLQGNVVDLAVGFTVGAAFTTVAKSIVDDIIMPPVGLLIGRVEFKDLFLVLQHGASGADQDYPTLAAAQADGAVTVNYGVFVNNVLALFLVGLAMFLIVKAVAGLDRAMDRLDDEPKGEDEPSHKKCPYCRNQIDYRAVRCPDCTSRLPGYEEREAIAAAGIDDTGSIAVPTPRSQAWPGPRA